VFVALIFVAGAATWLWKRLGGEERLEIDIDAVIDAKYPNRAEPGPLPDPPELPPPPAPPARRERRERDVIVDLLTAEPPEPELLVTPAFVATGFPPPVSNAGPDVPIPGEPDDLHRPSTTPAAKASGPLSPNKAESYAGDPYTALQRRRDRVAAQAAETFREVHKLRTQALRRASQAEHNASLATGARTRAGRMARDTKRSTAQGWRRPADAPTAKDAFDDVHHFRTEALKRAQQAEHGAQRVSQARERAARLLAEQRELEAEMAKLQRLRTVAKAAEIPVEALEAADQEPVPTRTRGFDGDDG
jgi:hypothetical protein